MSTVEQNAGGRGGPAVRRQLTILFCDLVDSTPLSASADPEDVHDLMMDYQHFCARQIEEAGGYVARFAGDGILAYFGYPVALEDAPQRAIHAGLALRNACEHVSRPDGAPLAVRVGVATGLVVVGDLTSQGAREHAVAGETPNLAARLQAFAQPNTVLVSDATKRLNDGFFAFRSLGPVSHKGLPTPSEAWEVMGPSATVSRYEGRRATGVNPLISRGDELEAILEAWRLSRAQHSCVVGIVGDPGMGKSRLLEETRRRIDRDSDVLWLEGGGASIYDNTPFHVASQLARLPASLDAPDERSSADLLAELLGTGADAPRRPSAKADHRRDELMGLLTRVIWAAAERRPTVLVVEDLHWADPSSLELLDLIVRAGGPQRLLLIYTSRTDVSDRWAKDVWHRTVSLKGLETTASAALAAAAGGGVLSRAQIDVVVSRAAGVPLYVEELARFSADHPAAGEHELPATLSDLLTARLEAAGPVKRHAQVASVLGQEFSAALFGAMIEADGADARAALDDLEARSIIVRVDGDTCAFRHALISRAAYATLLLRERPALHHRAATIIIEQHPALADARREVVAHHWTKAGELPAALATWEAAATSANQRRAFREAEHAYRQALTVLDGAGDARDQVELRIRAAFNRVLQITQGYSASEAGSSSERVSLLASRIGDPDALAREEQVKWRSVFTEGDYARAETIVERVMALTEHHGEAVWRRAFALRAGIQQGFYTGDIERAERDFLAWEVLQDGRHRGAGDDVLSMGIGALMAQATGRRSVALARSAASFDIAAQRGNPYDLAMAIHGQAGLLHLAQDSDQLALAAARLAAVAAESGFEYAGHLATAWGAIADLDAGRIAEGVEHATAAIKGFDRLGARVSMMFWLGILARGQALYGDTETAMKTFQRALEYNPQELVFVPGAYMARAHALQALGRSQEAGRDLAQVVQVARRLGARLYEFRAQTELAALCLASQDEAGHRRAMREAKAVSHFDHCPADLARFAELCSTT